MNTTTSVPACPNTHMATPPTTPTHPSTPTPSEFDTRAKCSADSNRMIAIAFCDSAIMHNFEVNYELRQIRREHSLNKTVPVINVTKSEYGVTMPRSPSMIF